MVVENNYGYTGPLSVQNGDTTLPGFERVDIRKRGRGCRTLDSDETAPSLVPKLSLANGLVYTYTKPPRDDDADVWYLTAIDFHTGETVWRGSPARASGSTTTLHRSPSPPTGPLTSECSAG